MCDTCNATKKIIEDWVGKQGHERCWYYPDLFRKLADLFDVATPERGLPPLAEFRQGCKRYQDEEYGVDPDVVTVFVSLALAGEGKERFAEVVEYLLLFYLGAGLERRGLKLMPDYRKMVVDNGQGSVLPTVSAVQDDHGSGSPV